MSQDELASLLPDGCTIERIGIVRKVYDKQGDLIAVESLGELTEETRQRLKLLKQNAENEQAKRNATRADIV